MGTPRGKLGMRKTSIHPWESRQSRRMFGTAEMGVCVCVGAGTRMPVRMCAWGPTSCQSQTHFCIFVCWVLNTPMIALFVKSEMKMTQQKGKQTLSALNENLGSWSKSLFFSPPSPNLQHKHKLKHHTQLCTHHILTRLPFDPSPFISFLLPTPAFPGPHPFL